MTDGVLLKEIENDFALRKYSVIIVDEAHERRYVGLYCWICPHWSKHAYGYPHRSLIANCSSQRDNGKRIRGCTVCSVIWNYSQHVFQKDKTKAKIAPLKLITMSATLRVDGMIGVKHIQLVNLLAHYLDFIKNPRLFSNRKVPVINVDARQYPVTVHFRFLELDHIGYSSFRSARRRGLTTTQSKQHSRRCQDMACWLHIITLYFGSRLAKCTSVCQEEGFWYSWLARWCGSLFDAHITNDNQAEIVDLCRRLAKKYPRSAPAGKALAPTEAQGDWVFPQWNIIW